jgi:hypothetical protein
METQIQSFAFSRRTPGHISLFGYSSKSVPGLEINGLGKYGRTLKEKIIFLTRSRQLPIPLNRYVISTEYEIDSDPNVLKWMDLPVLMLYWYLAGLLKMGRLDNCLVAGHISPSGEIFEKTEDCMVKLAMLENWLCITSEHNVEQRIQASDILGHIPQLIFNPDRKQILEI